MLLFTHRHHQPLFAFSVPLLEIEFERGNAILTARHRAQRFPFVTGIQVTGLDTEAHIAAHTEDLSVFGCFVEIATPFVPGTKVALKISHAGSIFVAQGRVVYSRAGLGMGIQFTSIQPSSASILDAWLTELREEASASSLPH